MKFILFSLNYAPEQTGIGKYNGEMCNNMALAENIVTAIVATPYYPEWKTHSGYSNKIFSSTVENGVSIIRCPLYVPNQVTTITRLIHLASFAFTSSLALFTKLFTKPDIIFLVQPTLFCAPGALLFGWLTGAKTIMHIHDFEVDVMLGLGMVGAKNSPNNIITKTAKIIERWLMKRFDAVSTISYTMIENAKSKGVAEDKIIYFPNWSGTNFVTPKTDGSLLKKEWGFKPTDRIILYAGNVGKKQGIEIILAVATDFMAQDNIKFVIVGSGAHSDELKKEANKLNLNNVFLKPLQSWERVPKMLALADIHLVIQRKDVSDAVLPSKLTNILSAGGHAIVTAEAHTELGQIEKKHPGIYTRVEPENLICIIEEIEKLLKQDLSQHNQVARSYAEEHLNKTVILDKFQKDLNQLVNS
ncbi:MAG: colanic acid biosynthesis glycosyl transferase WcaI [Salibacteraceae bacterium]|jgi:colanic acid biosynthesis glycosyl transferase WcaI